jgi:hypothetical protein
MNARKWARIKGEKQEANVKVGVVEKVVSHNEGLSVSWRRRGMKEREKRETGKSGGSRGAVARQGEETGISQGPKQRVC